MIFPFQSFISSYVSQEVKLFDETILNNIVMFDDNYKDQDKINRLLKVLNLDEFVNSLPEKLETVIGSEGIELSVGQKQRIGIARALYFSPQVLVLDESTSALDSITERLVMEGLKNASDKMTILIIAHRINTVKKCLS